MAVRCVHIEHDAEMIYRICSDPDAPLQRQLDQLDGKEPSCNFRSNVFVSTLHEDIFHIGQVSLTNVTSRPRRWLPTVTLMLPGAWKVHSSADKNSDITLASTGTCVNKWVLHPTKTITLHQYKITILISDLQLVAAHPR